MPDSPPVTKRSAEPEAAADAEADALLAEAEAEALDAEAEALADEALPLPDEHPAKTAAIPAAAPTPMKLLLVKFFMFVPSLPCGPDANALDARFAPQTTRTVALNSVIIDITSAH